MADRTAEHQTPSGEPITNAQSVSIGYGTARRLSIFSSSWFLRFLMSLSIVSSSANLSPLWSQDSNLRDRLKVCYVFKC